MKSSNLHHLYKNNLCLWHVQFEKALSPHNKKPPPQKTKFLLYNLGIKSHLCPRACYNISACVGRSSGYHAQEHEVKLGLL